MVAAEKLRAVVEQDYAAFALGEKYYGAVHTWGYTHELLNRLGMNASDELHKKLFKAACGGGCPLLLTPGYSQAPVRLLSILDAAPATIAYLQPNLWAPPAVSLALISHRKCSTVPRKMLPSSRPTARP